MHRPGCGSPGARRPSSGIPRGAKWERLAGVGLGAHTPLTGAPRHGPPGAAAPSRSPHRLRDSEGRRGRPGGLGIRSSPRCPGPPGSRGSAVDSSQAADQMGIIRRTRGRSLRPARPIPAEEGSDQRAANTRAAARVGRGLAAGDFGSRRLRLRFGAAHHGLGPEAKAGPLGRRAWGRREAAERTTGALGAGRRLWGRGQEAGAVCRLLAQLAARVAAQSRRLAGCPPPPPPWAPEGALRAESHLGAEAPGTPSRTGSWAPPPPSRFARLER
ncbi:hypothetical protein R6Z07M_001485 [Ovis aries]